MHDLNTFADIIAEQPRFGKRKTANLSE